MRGKPRATFLTEAAARPVAGDPAFRERRASKLVTLLFFVALTGGFAAAAWIAASQDAKGLAAVMAMSAVALMIMLMIAYTSFQASGHPTNWILRATRQGLFIHYRSYLNSHLPADRDTVLYLPHREIDWVRGGRQTRRRGVPGDTSTLRQRFLEIGLRRKDMSGIAEKFAEERAVTTAAPSRFNHYPVQIAAGRIRIEWRSPRTAITPGLRHALDVLGQYYAAAPTADSTIASDEALLDIAAQEARIRDYVAHGDSITAIKLARYYFGYDLSAASAYVKRLEERN